MKKASFAKIIEDKVFSSTETINAYISAIEQSVSSVKLDNMENQIPLLLLEVILIFLNQIKFQLPNEFVGGLADSIFQVVARKHVAVSRYVVQLYVRLVLLV